MHVCMMCRMYSRPKIKVNITEQNSHHGYYVSASIRAASKTKPSLVLFTYLMQRIINMRRINFIATYAGMLFPELGWKYTRSVTRAFLKCVVELYAIIIYAWGRPRDCWAASGRQIRISQITFVFPKHTGILHSLMLYYRMYFTFGDFHSTWFLPNVMRIQGLTDMLTRGSSLKLWYTLCFKPIMTGEWRSHSP